MSRRAVHRPSKNRNRRRFFSPGCEQLEPRLPLSASPLAVYDGAPHIPAQPEAEEVNVGAAEDARPEGTASTIGPCGESEGAVADVKADVKADVTNSPYVQSDLDRGRLVIIGTGSNDEITVRRKGSQLKVKGTTNGTQLSWSYTAARVRQLIVAGESGDDQIRINTAVTQKTTLFGGAGRDVIFGGGGTDRIYGGSGRDLIYGRDGNDRIWGGPAADNDVLRGGQGTDTVFRRGPGLGNSTSSFEAQVINLTNLERTGQGLPALTADPLLNHAAGSHADQMAERAQQIGNASAHNHRLFGVDRPTPMTRIDAAGFDWSAFGENIAYGYRTAAEVVQAWMNSPAHRANILNPNFTHLGVGYQTSAAGTPFWVQNFGRPA